MKKSLKFLLLISGIATTFLALIAILYFYIIPPIVASHRLHEFISKKIYEHAGINVVIKNVKLDTKHVPYVIFTAEDFEIFQNKQPIIILKNFDTKLSLRKIRFKKIILNKLGADYIFTDVNKLISIIPESKKGAKSDWYVDIINSYLYVNKTNILYNIDDIFFDIKANNIKLDNSQTDKKYIKFDFKTMIKQGKNLVKVTYSDNNKVYIKDNEIHIDKSKIDINESKLMLQAKIKDDKKYSINISADKFNISNIVTIIKSNIFIPNGSELLSYFNNIQGNFDFKINLTEKGLDGNIFLKRLYFLLIPIENVPVHLVNGKLIIDKKNIAIKDFSGYYGTHTYNKVKFSGKIKDYMKTFETDIIADGVVTNDFAKYYLSPVIGVPVGIVGKADTRVILKYLNGLINLKWLFKVSPEDNLLVSGEPISKYKEERVVVSNMVIDGFILKIKDLKYYVTVPGVKEFYRRKLISLNGIIDFSKGVDFREMGFEIERPVPSEFLNIIIRQEIFKNGTAVGKMKAVDGPKGVKLFGNIVLKKIVIPSQRLYLKKAELDTNFNTINFKATGGYRRSKYTAEGNIVNNIAFPIIVNNINFKLDSMDFKKLLNSFNQQGETAEAKHEQTKVNVENDDDAPTFDLNNLIIKKCNFELKEGIYDDLGIKNLIATLSLINGDLEINSNRFDFAKGHSSCHACCDINKHKYHVKLGVKDVDSNLIATSLLNLTKEISGKASGLIDLHTDKTFNLNGDIKFIVKDGTIGKIGLIEYILNVASVFRNPFAMISPATIFDLINIPDGKFEKIQGELKIENNIIEQIKIKSFAQYLGAYISGRYDLEKQDASLRIYTKFSNKKKGIYGILRYLSLGTIASHVSSGARNDVNYYSSEIAEIPKIDASEKDTQLFLTTVDGDVATGNFISSLRKLK